MWTCILTKFPSRSTNARTSNRSTWAKWTANSHVVPAGSVPSSGKMKVPCSAGLAAAGEARQTARMAPTPQIVPNLRIENPFPHRWPAVDLLYRHPLRGGLACQGAVASRLAILELAGEGGSRTREREAYFLDSCRTACPALQPEPRAGAFGKGPPCPNLTTANPHRGSRP